MCDCPRKRDDKIGPETVTIFSKCPTLYRPAEEILEQHTILTRTLTSIDFVQSNSNSDTSCDSARTSTESSSESSRTYKFVYPECEYPGEAEEEAAKLLPVCFEPERAKEVVEIELDIEYTLAIIKPEAMIHKDQIEYRMFTEGFEICQTRLVQLTPEQASEFYSDHFGELSFPHLVAYMSSGPIMVLVLARQNAVEEWKRIMGPITVAEARMYFPDSIRAKYGSKEESFKNIVHGSCSRDQAEKEIHFFFPEFILESLLRGQMAEDYLWETLNPILAEGLALCCKTKPVDPVLWLAHWLILNNPNEPKLPEDLALIPT